MRLRSQSAGGLRSAASRYVSEQVAPAEQLTVVSCALLMLNEHVLAVAHVMVES